MSNSVVIVLVVDIINNNSNGNNERYNEISFVIAQFHAGGDNTIPFLPVGHLLFTQTHNDAVQNRQVERETKRKAQGEW